MADNNKLKEKLQSRIDKFADEKRKLWFENYIKHDTKYRGVEIPTIRAELKDWYKHENIDKLPLDEQLDLALSFFEEEYAEDKLAGILFLQLYLYNKFDYKKLLSRFETIFENGYIYDWSVCDWFCTRVLRQMIKANGRECAEAISEWHTANNVWQARCSVVAFTTLTKDNQYTSLLLKSNVKLIKREERFAKTAVGWILRELSKVDKQIVVDFIAEYRQYFSRESHENAIKYFDKNEKKKMRELFKSIS
ncbi:MAG: DNA alkylation repair protein [Candidatus Poribacteria bacterium]|nr:DNA alkylation repair protein [Candidatus Poribacteria bacterium]